MTQGGEILKEEFSALSPLLLKFVNTSVEDALCTGTMDSTKWKLLLGTVVFGERYIDLFLNYCLPSVVGFGNLPGITNNPLWLLIHTDEAGSERIKRDGKIQFLALLGICVEIRKIPKEILEECDKNPMNKYWVLSACHNIQMQTAKYHGYGYHPLMPDHVYSRYYFNNLHRLAQDNDAIVQGALSANYGIDLAKDGLTDIDAKELNAIALDNLHNIFVPYLMNGRDIHKDCPINNFLIYVGDTVRILCPHMTPVYLSARNLAKCPTRLFNTIDTQLPFFIPESAKVTVPRPEDDMSYIEVSHQDKCNYFSPMGNLISFCIRYWMLVCGEVGFLRYLNMETRLALPDGYTPPFKRVGEDEIDKAFSSVREKVVELHKHIMEELPEEFQRDELPQRAA